VLHIPHPVRQWKADSLCPKEGWYPINVFTFILSAEGNVRMGGMRTLETLLLMVSKSLNCGKSTLYGTNRKTCYFFRRQRSS
jgi:hypothetical protein